MTPARPPRGRGRPAGGGPAGRGSPPGPGCARTPSRTLPSICRTRRRSNLAKVRVLPFLTVPATPTSPVGRGHLDSTRCPSTPSRTGVRAVDLLRGGRRGTSWLMMVCRRAHGPAAQGGPSTSRTVRGQSPRTHATRGARPRRGTCRPAGARRSGTLCPSGWPGCPTGPAAGRWYRSSASPTWRDDSTRRSAQQGLTSVRRTGVRRRRGATGGPDHRWAGARQGGWSCRPAGRP